MRPADRHSRSGFTLIEIVVALVVSMVVITALFRTLIGQTRYVDRQQAREEVQQNARSSVELISSELRALHGGAIAAADARGITFRLPRVWGVICHIPTSGAKVIQVAFPPNSLPAGFSGNTGWGAGVELATGGWEPPNVITKSTVILPADTKCDGTQDASILQLELTNATSGTLQSRLFIYETVRYAVATADGRVWLQRSFGTTGMQPLAGPLLDNGGSPHHGLKFDYYDMDVSSSPLPTPVSSANLALVDAIGVAVKMRSSNPDNAMQVDSVSMLVHLRNN